MEVRTGRLVYEQPPGLFTEHTDKFTVDVKDVDSDTDEKSNMFKLSRLFLHRVNDRVRKIQDQSSKHATQQRQTLCDTRNVHFFYITSICVHGEKLLRQFTFHQNTGRDLTTKQMFDISEKLLFRKIKRNLWSELNPFGIFFMETFIFGWWWKSHQSLAH